jgi:hypothetical protein
MRIKFLVRDELDESTIRKTLEPILTGIERTTHKVSYRTSIGVVEYVSMPLGSSMNRYSSANVSGTLRKISLWNRDSTDELEKMLRSKSIEMTEIAKDGPKTLELKK